MHYPNIDYWEDGAIRTTLAKLNRPRCGQCECWMIKSLCSREEARIVSMNDPICNDFKRSFWYQEQVEELEQELIIRNL